MWHTLAAVGGMYRFVPVHLAQRNGTIAQTAILLLPSYFFIIFDYSSYLKY
jgi:hypothetical protein